jgi:hypothetical protein
LALLVYQQVQQQHKVLVVQLAVVCLLFFEL